MSSKIACFITDHLLSLRRAAQGLNMNPYLRTAQSYLSKLTALLESFDRTQVDNAIKVIADAWQAGRQIITLGNGGSSMTALHFINDWNKSVFMATGKPFRGRSLSTTWAW